MSKKTPVVREMTDHDRYWLRLAYSASLASDDQQTQVGAVIARGEELVCRGVNRFAYKKSVRPDRLVSPEKYHWMIHAESLAIFRMLKQKENSVGTVMFCPWACCSECAKNIIMGGVKLVVAHYELMLQTSDKWKHSIDTAQQMLKEAGISYVQVSGTVGNIQTTMFGKQWNP